MSESALVEVRCPVHHIGMEQRPLSKQTPEQMFCGAWWDCVRPGCKSSILFQSAELVAHLESFKAPLQKKIRFEMTEPTPKEQK